MEEQVKGIPFWDDLFAVTCAVPPWSIFKLLAEQPQIISRVPVPLTFLVVPGDKIEARLCTGLDHKLLIRRSTVRDQISFETMATNLKACFDARGSDGQPFVCTVYGEDLRPYFVLSELFNLFILYLRHSCGEASSSYGPEEQREAMSLFPTKVSCIQAYLPLESQTRYLAVMLRSPINSLMEVYRTSHLGKGCFSNSRDTLDTIVPQHTPGDNDFYKPLYREDPDAHLAVRMSASIVSNLRKQCDIKIPGIVFEFVRDIQGDLYLTGVSRCSKTHAPMMKARIKPILESDLERIIGKYGTHTNSGSPMSSSRRLARGKLKETTPEPDSPNLKTQSVPRPGGRKKGFLPLSLIVDEEVHQEGLDTAMQTAGKAKRKISVFALDKRTSTHSEEKGKTGGLDLNDPHPRGKTLEQEPGAMNKDGVMLCSVHQALIQEAERLHDQGRFEESLQVLGDAEKAALSAIARQQPEQAAVIKANPPNAECFRCGDTVYANLAKSGYAHFEWRNQFAAASQAAKKVQEKVSNVNDAHAQKRQNKLSNSSRRSRRTMQLDKGEVVRRPAPLVLRENMSSILHELSSEVGPQYYFMCLVGMIAVSCENILSFYFQYSVLSALQDLEVASYKTTPREAYDNMEKKRYPTTMCKQCLDEAKRDVRNRPLVRGIQKFRNELSISVLAGVTP